MPLAGTGRRSVGGVFDVREEGGEELLMCLFSSGFAAALWSFSESLGPCEVLGGCVA